MCSLRGDLLAPALEWEGLVVRGGLGPTCGSCGASLSQTRSLLPGDCWLTLGARGTEDKVSKPVSSDML